MKKLIGAISAIFCLSGAAFAAPTHGSHSLLRGRSLWLGVDTEFGIPLGNYSDANSVGYGAVFTAEYALLEMLGATARIGFEGHMDRAIGTNLSAHVHAIPVLLGTKYYIGPDRAGLFGAFELGMFDLMSSVDTPRNGTTTSTTGVPSSKPVWRAASGTSSPGSSRGRRRLLSDQARARTLPAGSARP